MKTLNWLVMATCILFSTLSVSGQTAVDSVSPCPVNQQKSTLTVEQLTLFNQLGINLNNYKWDNPDINCHINSAVQDFEMYKFNMRVGGYGVGLGLAGVPIGLVFQSALGTGVGLIIIGSACLVGGGYLIFRGLKRKKSQEMHVGVVADYYRVNKI
ncbi:MAG: hypothetical protein GC181_10635 [Bacteroidetes bacterium]|nr:hypothetical protein [Bacteroidota bacterium]